MEHNLEELYTKKEVVEMTSAPDVTINRWSQELRDTNLVVKIGGRIYYTPNFIKFIRFRIDNHGPSNLPDAQQIESLFDMWSKYDGDVNKIIASSKNPIVTRLQLISVGLMEV